MNRRTAACAAVVLASAAALGCNSNAYQPDADPPKLSSYATQNKYPADMTAEPAKDISYSVDGNGTITLLNASDRTLGSFDLWVNKSFVIMVDQLPAHNNRMIAPELIYNNGGQNLKSVAGRLHLGRADPRGRQAVGRGRPDQDVTRSRRNRTG